jgi:nitrogen fixation-related uncharacterized protein
MDLTWLAMIASLCMGLSAASLFVFAVKNDHFEDLENAKYQVFRSDLSELEEQDREGTHGLIEMHRAALRSKRNP